MRNRTAAVKAQKPSRFALLFTVALLAIPAAHAGPAVANVRVAQRPGTTLVDITYDLADPDSATLSVSVAVSTDGGASYGRPATHFTGAVGGGVTPGTGKRITWDAGADLPAKLFSNVRVSVTASDNAAPSGMALIPAGSFTMGNCMDPNEGSDDELPLHTVYISAFYMDKNDVTWALWQQVYNWAIIHGYTFDNAGSGKAANHPVQTVNWYDCVKWCNARSEMEGRTPAYYTSAAQTTVYRTSQVDLQNDWVKWNSGYRLPTEAEWEKAARGGLSGQRFPWGNTISWSQANYYTYPLLAGGYAYDVNPTGGFDPTFNGGGYPFTSPVGDFAPNGYGLYDMAGNVWQWCWDWYGPYSSGSQTDPHGPIPISGPYRVIRGGSWNLEAFVCRTAFCFVNYPTNGDCFIGFRSVLPPGQ